MTIGYEQNNPGNLTKGGVVYDGEIASGNRFRAFSSLAYGIRAWIVNLMYKKNVRGINTYGAYLSAYAPVSDGNSPDYPAAVVGNDFELNEIIKTDYNSVRTLFFNQVAQEIAPDDRMISDYDFNQAWALYTGSAAGMAYGLTNVLPGNYFMVGLLVLVIASLVTLFIVANKQ